MSKASLGGVIAAVATPILSNLEPDLGRFTFLSRWLLDSGCDGLNICGTTGEATSFSVSQRRQIMEAAGRSLPRERLMVGTGAAAVADAVTLTRHAATLGFSGALVLPPFYYKGIDEDGIVRYIGEIVEATSVERTDIYLYNFPAMTGIVYSAGLVSRLVGEFGDRIAGLKNSSGDLSYARSIVSISSALRVFPSNEAVLLDARAGKFAGCISASANINSNFCARAFRAGDEGALAIATRLRGLVSHKALIPSIKTVLARRLGDPAFEAVMPPLTGLGSDEKRQLLEAVDAVLNDNLAWTG